MGEMSFFLLHKQLKHRFFIENDSFAFYRFISRWKTARNATLLTQFK